jgi:RNA polymerase sigma factor (sigma-70 family)
MPPPDFERLVHQYHQVVTAAIIKYSRGRVRADDLPDLEQEVWARVWRAMQSPQAAYDPQRGAITTYLYLITRSVCFNIFERNRHDPMNRALALTILSRSGAWEVRASTVPSLRDEDTEARLVTADVLARFRAVAAQAEDAAQLLRYFEACAASPRSTEHRVAKELGTTVGVVRQLRARARTLLLRLGAA